MTSERLDRIERILEAEQKARLAAKENLQAKRLATRESLQAEREARLAIGENIASLYRATQLQAENI